MVNQIKRILYFPFAWYFRFFAQIKLSRWNPRVIVVTGSVGKTTTLGLIESQLSNSAYYSHHANSAFGIPFNILGIKRETLKPIEWIGLFLTAPFKTFSKVPSQKLYIVEADCDRPGEGKFLAELLKPEVTIWVSSSRTHSMNFDQLVKDGKFTNVEDAISFEYGWFLQKTKKLSIVNDDSQPMVKQIVRSKSEVIKIGKQTYLESYKIEKNKTTFKIKGNSYEFGYLLPEATYFSITAIQKLLFFLQLPFNPLFANFKLPPGRSNLFKGVKNTTLIDSTYNTGLEAMTSILGMFSLIKAVKKWVVLGDILEQGKEEKEEHEKLAKKIIQISPDRVVLMGPRISKYTYPIVSEELGSKIPVITFINPKEVLDYLTENIKGDETILFKGARFLEGVIANLLADKADIKLLPRREKVWEERRKKWGL